VLICIGICLGIYGTVDLKSVSEPVRDRIFQFVSWFAPTTSPTVTPTPPPKPTPAPIATPTSTPKPTPSPSPSSTATPTPSPTPKPIRKAIPLPTPSPTAIPEHYYYPESSATPDYYDYTPSQSESDQTDLGPYVADFVNKTKATLFLEHLYEGEWVQFEIPPGETWSVGSDTAKLRVRLCECHYSNAAAAGSEWRVNTIKSNNRANENITFEFFTDRKGKIDLR
jgi:hypothetical protein